VSFRLSRLALADLREIGRFTLERWGLAQRRAYLRSIDAWFAALARDPQLGRQRQDIGPGWHSAMIGSHVIFYKVADRDIEIVRVLHSRMDIWRHLPPPGEGPA
jgi:toxin ParE1/3/4